MTQVHPPREKPAQPPVKSYADHTRFSAHKHALEERVKIRVGVIPMRMQIGDSLVDQGDQVVVIPRSTLEGYRRMVGDHRRMADAQRRYEKMEAAWIDEHGESERHKSPHSMSKAYFHMYGEDPPALEYLEVIEEGLPAIGMPDDKRQRDLGDDIAKGIAEGIAKAMSPVNSELEQLRAENAALKDMLQSDAKAPAKSKGKPKSD